MSNEYEPEYISVSRINAYSGSFGCPKRYFFSYVLGLRSRWTGASLAIGSGIGRALQSIKAINAGDPLAVWMGEWEDYCHKTWDGIDPDVDREAMVSKGADMLRALYTAGVHNVTGIPECEIVDAVIHCPDTGEELPPLVGYMDWYCPITHRVTELKTGRSIANWENHLVQLAVYRWAATKPEAPPSVELIQVNKSKAPKVERQVVTITDNQEKWVMGAIAKTVRAIRAGHFPERPSYACRSCEFRGACQEGDFSGLVEKH